jgi:hypothetical protein
MTVSPSTGTDAPVAPPDVADQMEVSTAFHTTDPPPVIRYLLAIVF